VLSADSQEAMDLQRLIPGTPADAPAGAAPPAPPAQPGRAFGDLLASTAAAHAQAQASPLPLPPAGAPAAPAAAAAPLLAGPPDPRAPQASGGAGSGGDAFVLVRRHGSEYHVYGTGKDRQVYEVPRTP
jgi:hypothetical protein